MNFGQIAKRHVFEHGFTTPITMDNAPDEIQTKVRLEKANAALGKLKDIFVRKWKIEDDD